MEEDGKHDFLTVLKNLVKELTDKSEDVDLLDLVYKILLQG